MWIPKSIAESNGERNAVTAKIVYADGNGINVVGSENEEKISVAVPYGIAYVPPAGEKAVVIPVGNSSVLCGVVSENPLDLESGEIGLYSSGGASIILKRDGTVVINGQVFAKE